jgi:hypothetical protein
MLQVYYPHLENTVEVLQVDRVIARMNEFLRLMHEGLIVRATNERSIDTAKEIVRGRQWVEPIRDRLQTAFPVRPEHTEGDNRPLVVTETHAHVLSTRFAHLASTLLPGLTVEWEPQAEPGILHGTARLGSRIQPLTLTRTHNRISLSQALPEVPHGLARSSRRRGAHTT